MRKATHIMLLLGKIFGFIGAAALLGVGIYTIVNAGSAPNAEAQATQLASGIWDIILAVGSCLAAIIAVIFGPEVENIGPNAKRNAILCIVFGAIGAEPFVVLGGIFGLVLRAQENQ